MGKNEEVRFGTIPPPEVPRSVFDLSHDHMTSFNVGELIPLDWLMIEPGDTIKYNLSQVVRFQTLLTPTFANVEFEVDAFFVPLRLIYGHTKEFYGENTSGPWIQNVSYQFPSISAPSGGFATGTLADYFGLPVGIDWSATDPGAPMALPFRSYGQVVNDWWLSEALNYPANVPTGDSNQVGTNGGNYINDICNGGKPFVAAKYFDLFSSSLPSPQKGPSVTFPLIAGTKAPVMTNATDLISGAHTAMSLAKADGSSTPTGDFALAMNNHKLFKTSASGPTTDGGLYPANLYADLTSSVGAVTVNELRLAFQLQKFYEKCARGGKLFHISCLHVKKIAEKLESRLKWLIRGEGRQASRNA